MVEIIVTMHLDLSDADKAQLEAWMKGTATLNLKNILDLLSRVTTYSVNLATKTPTTITSLTEEAVYP